MWIYFLTLDGCVSHLVSTYFRPVSHDYSYVVCPFCGYGISFSRSLFISQWHLLLCVQCFSHSLWLDDESVRNAKILFCKRFLLINLNNPPVKSKLKLLQNEMFSGLLGSDCRGFGLFAWDWVLSFFITITVIFLFAALCHRINCRSKKQKHSSENRF